MQELKKIFIESNERLFGITQNDGSIFFSVPKQLMPKKETNQEIIKKLLLYSDLLIKYEKTKSFSLINNNNKANHLINLSFLNGLIGIMDDYEENGYYFIYMNELSKTNKKINWSKTIRSQDVFVEKNLVIHNNFLSKSKKINYNHNVYKAYEIALKIASHFLKNSNTPLVELSISKLNKIKNDILNYEDSCFSDRDLKIINCLKLIFLNQYSFKKNLGENFSYHEKFEIIWEHMIDNILPLKFKLDQKKIKIPKGKYVFLNQDKKSILGAEFRIDHILSIDKNLLILDSKFYNFYHDNTAPKTESISKQENYLKILSNKSDFFDFNFYNFFIFPKNNVLNADPEYFAYHEMQSDLHNIVNFKIKCIAVDLKKIIHFYLSNKYYNDLVNLCYNIKDI